jgi:hypothetical protein
MDLHPMMGHPMGHDGAPEAAAADAAALAREQADRAWDHAQRLTQLADATTALQQALTTEQRQVFDEAARHFAREHGGHGGMGPMDEGGYRGAMEDHCERGMHGMWHGEGHAEYGNPHGYGAGHGACAHPHGHDDDGDDADEDDGGGDPHGEMMESPHDAKDAHGAPGTAAH